MTQPKRRTIDPWDTRFAWYWYGDHGPSGDAQDDLDRQAKALATVGINHVMTTSSTHFRWSYRRYWDQITQALSRVVRACHAHGILVTEHHSSHLTFNPQNEQEQEWMRWVLGNRHSSLSLWPHIREDCDADPDINGVPLSSLRQVDGRTGQWARSRYRGWCMCFNNPDFRRAYLAYLATLYETGIDGIMTDDVQWFGEEHSCACAHCRRLFKEQTGYEMPQPGPDWVAWHGSYSPSYVAWLDFRFRSIVDFHVAVKDHYERLGLRPLRPNYRSDVLNRNPTGYALEAVPHLDWIFQECLGASVIRYSWPHYAIEASHRFAVGRRRGIPSMALLYPDRPDNQMLSWALSMSWGQMYTGMPVSTVSETTLAAMRDEERGLRQFEKAHPRLLRNQRRLSNLGFYDSRSNRYLYKDAEARSLRALRAWMQACVLHNVPYDLFQKQELDRLSHYDVVVLNEVAFLSEEELSAFHRFVVDGGTLVWTGRTGTMDERGLPRSTEELARLWGLENMAGTEDGDPPTAHPVGRGKLVLLGGDLWLGPTDTKLRVNRQTNNRVPFPLASETDRERWSQITRFLVVLLPSGPALAAEDLPRDVIVTAYETADGQSLTVHLVNAAGTLDVPEGDLVGYSDPIPFPAHAGPTIRIRLHKPRTWSGRTVSKARYLDPKVEGATALQVEDSEDVVCLDIDPRLIKEYGLVELGR